MNCHYCKNPCVKSGIRKGLQRYRCKTCKKYQQAVYTKARIPQEKYDWVVKLSNESCGISNIARLLQISKSSVQRIIERIVVNLKMPEVNECGQNYEIDDLRTCLKRLARKTICFTRSERMLYDVVCLWVRKQ